MSVTFSACLDHLEGQGIEDLAEVRGTHLRAFLAEKQKRRPAVSSQARTTAALKSFFRLLIEASSPPTSATPTYRLSAVTPTSPGRTA